MDVLANISIDTFKLLVWVVAIVIGVLLFFCYPREKPLEIVGAALKGVLGAAITFALTSLGVVFYILSHPTDARWSLGKDPALKAPEFTPGVPFFDQIVDTLNSFMGSVAGSVNDLFAIRNAFLATPDFLVMAGWGMIMIVPLLIAIRIVGWRDEVRRKKQDTKNAATIERLSSEVEAIKAHLHLPPSTEN